MPTANAMSQSPPSSRSMKVARFVSTKAARTPRRAARARDINVDAFQLSAAEVAKYSGQTQTRNSPRSPIATI